MEFVVIFLLALNLVVPVWGALRFCLNREGLAIDHVLMFSLGYMVYWIVPIAVGVAHFFPDAPAMAAWYALFRPITQRTQALYLMITLSFYGAFWLGSVLGRRRGRRTATGYKQIFFFRRLLTIPWAAGIAIAVLYAFLLRDQFFHGYTLDVASANWDANRGSFTASSVFLLSLAFLYSLKRNEELPQPPTPRRLFFHPYFVVYFLVAMLVLSLGGRLYVLSATVMLLVCWTVYFRRIPGRTALGAFLIALTLVGIEGVVRQDRQVSTEAVLLGLFQEPLFTGFPLINYLHGNTFELLRFPIFLASDFLNLVPSALLPNKIYMLISPEDYGFSLFNPLGALNSFFSFMINFGVLGTLPFMFGYGWLLSLIRSRDRNLLSRVVYIMLSGWTGFTFFRDDFQTALIKSMLQFSVLVPIATVISLQLASVYLRSLRKPIDAAEQG